MSAHKLLFFCLIAMSSCRAISFDELRPLAEQQPAFPALHPMIDTLSLTSFYWNDPSVHPLPLTPVTLSTQRHWYSYDQRVQDAIVLFDREVKDNLTNPVGESHGSIHCKIVTGECRYSTARALISLATLLIPNLFGVAFNHHMTHLELEVEIYDVRNNLISRYSATGYSQIPIALWRGYRPQHASRLSNLNAFSNAMREIRKNIMDDAQEINLKLSMEASSAKR